VTEERVDTSTADTDGTTAEAAVSSGGQTAEEIEAFWRNRQSGVDRAHNAEVAALKAQLDAAKAPPVTAPVGESPEAAQVRQLQAELAQAQAEAKAATLRSQFPQAAGVLGDEITNLSPEKVAAIEAWADGGQQGPAPMIDPNAAARGNGAVQAPQAKPLNEKTKDELLADLQRATPQMQAEAREGIYR
jgi:hypothetical protein